MPQTLTVNQQRLDEVKANAAGLAKTLGGWLRSNGHVTGFGSGELTTDDPAVRQLYATWQSVYELSKKLDALDMPL